MGLRTIEISPTANTQYKNVVRDDYDNDGVNNGAMKQEITYFEVCRRSPVMDTTHREHEVIYKITCVVTMMAWIKEYRQNTKHKRVFLGD